MARVIPSPLTTRNPVDYPGSVQVIPGLERGLPGAGMAGWRYFRKCLFPSSTSLTWFQNADTVTLVFQHVTPEWAQEAPLKFSALG